MTLVCSTCDRKAGLATSTYRCACGGAYDLDHSWSAPLLPATVARRAPTMWRYREALPLASAATPVTLGEGMTPLVAAANTDTLQWKLDFLMPTGSYKDRGASLLLSLVRDLEVSRVIEDSSGNAGAAIAAYCAAAGIDCTIYCPAATSVAKLGQISAHGAVLERVPGNRAATSEAIMAAADSVFYASHNWHPFFLHGVKTLAFEIVEQLDWSAPSAVICPVGFGSVYLGLHLGFCELRDAGLIEALPRLYGVQSASCCPLAAAFAAGATTVQRMPQQGTTLAEGITAELPMRGAALLAACDESDGAFTSVDEDAIAAGWRRLAAAGLFVEPTAAVVAAGWQQLTDQRRLPPTGPVVGVLTGSGLKAADKLAELTAP
jgi:threonine synthase